MLSPNYFRRGDPFALMRSMMRNAGSSFVPASSQAVFPQVNLYEGDDGLAITAELPGVDPSDIDITVKEDVLTLSGERKPPQVSEDVRWHRQERSYGKFSRAIRLPFQARDDRVEARFENGVLRILVGRPEEDKPRKIEIKAA